MMKNDARKRIMEIKKGLSPFFISEASSVISRRIESLPRFAAAESIALYWPLNGEVDLRTLAERWCGEKRVFLPVMTDSGDLELRRYSKNCPMECAAYGVMEPSEGTESAHDADIILVPGVAFDRNGGRLGRGKGYYDRFLSKCNGYKVGVCFGFQLLESVPVEQHDVKMDIVITEL